MKSRITLIIQIALIFWIPASAGMTRGQNVPDSVFNYTYEMLHACRDSVKIQSKIIVNDDTIIIKQASIIIRDSTINFNDEIAIEKLKNDLIPPVQPLISWDGFYVNFIPAYVFDPANVSNQIIKTLKYAISGEFSFKIYDKIKLVIESVLPIGDKFRIQGKVGWRIF